MSEPDILITLSHDEALVLFECDLGFDRGEWVWVEVLDRRSRYWRGAGALGSVG
jgi:hypothetical protein